MGRSTDYSNCYLYHIKDKDGIVHYVGSTSNMNSRKSGHRHSCNNENCKNYNLDIYRYIRDKGGFDNFEIIPIKKIENVSNKTDLLIAEQEEMNKFSGLKNKIGSYRTEEEHIEISRKASREWKKKNPDYHQREDPQKRRETEKKYREAHKEKYIEYQRKYREKQKQLKDTDQ
jgi:hypothetical protein